MIHHEYEVWEAYTNSDLTEGRGHKVTIGYFQHKQDALLAAQGQRVMGTNANVKQTTVTVTIYESWEEYKQDCIEHTKQAALAKLTRLERQALGL